MSTNNPNIGNWNGDDGGTVNSTPGTDTGAAATGPTARTTSKPSRGGRGGSAGKSNVQRGAGRQRAINSGKQGKHMPIASAPSDESAPPEYLNLREANAIQKKQQQGERESGSNSFGLINNNNNNNSGTHKNRGGGNEKTTTTKGGGNEIEKEQAKCFEGRRKRNSDDFMNDNSDNTSEPELEYCGSDLQLLKRTKPRRLESDIIGLPHTDEQGVKRQKMESKSDSRRKQNLNADCSEWSQVVVIASDDGGGDAQSGEEDSMLNEAYDDAMAQKENVKQTEEKTDTAAKRKYVGLTEFERGVPRIDAYGRASTLARGNPALFEIQFLKKDVLSGPPFPLLPPNGIIIWLCRTCREISNRTKGRSYFNGRTIFTIDLCKPCRIKNCEVRECFNDQNDKYGTMKLSDIEEPLKKFPYAEQYNQLAGAPYSLTRTEALVILACEHCRTVTSSRQSTRDVNGRCRITIDLCQKCTDVNCETSMALHPTQAELNRSKDKREYFAGQSNDASDGGKNVIHTHGKCVRD